MRPPSHTPSKSTIEVAADEYAPDLDAAYKSIANQVKIPGFRKGKIPRTIIDAQIGADVVRDEFIHSAVPSYYRQAIADEDLAPITDPEIDLEAFTDVTAPLIFTAVVEVRPRLELTQDDYFGVKVSRPAVEVSEADIDDWIDRLRERFSELEPAERPVREGDFATVDVKGTASGCQLVKTAKLYFLDTGLCAYLTQWSSPQTLEAGAMSGPMLETWVVVEILKSYLHNGRQAPLYFYRDKDKLEIDLVIMVDGTFHPVEIKKTASPSKRDVRSFGALAKLGYPIGPGGVICLSEIDVPLTGNARCIPVAVL